ncbi:hypothetical protein F5I97DRAFT_1815977 [Phlebopus sp. FC_14]|nr:hypothetical protein F5I97DRAFT_1815977 [Phlebopus sp. FC_14]
MSHFSKLASVHRGIIFEQRSLHTLQDHFSMSLRRVGGKSDGGIDLVGWWWLPFLPLERALSDPDGILRRPLRIFAQCKAEKKKFSPNYVREMEGVWHIQSRTPAPSASHEAGRGDSSYMSVALLLSESSFSHSTLLRAYQSTVPFLLVHLPTTVLSPSPSLSFPPPFGDDFRPSPNHGNFGAVYPNPTLTNLVSPLVIRWERTTPSLGDSDAPLLVHGRPGLWWQGHRLRSWSPDVTEDDPHR